MPERTPEERVLQARMAAHKLHAGVTDPSAHTAPARQAFLDRFEKQVDPDGALSPQERARRAEHARKAYFLGLALKSAKARRKSSEAVARKRANSPLAHDTTIEASAPQEAA